MSRKWRGWIKVMVLVGSVLLIVLVVVFLVLPQLPLVQREIIRQGIDRIAEKVKRGEKSIGASRSGEAVEVVSSRPIARIEDELA